LPTFIYIYKNASEEKKERLRNLPLLKLFYIGFVIVIVIFAFFTIWTREDITKKYTPPKYDNGKLIEGKFE
jgi:hypothetical protein